MQRIATIQRCRGDDHVRPDVGPIAVELDEDVGDDVLGHFVGWMVAPGLGEDGLAPFGRATGCADHRLLDEERTHVVEAPLVEAGAEAVDELGDLVVIEPAPS